VKIYLFKTGGQVLNLNVMKRMLSFVLTLALLMSNVSAVAFATEEETAAPTEAIESELEATIEKQIRAFAKSIDKPGADDDAAMDLAMHGMFQGGKKLSVGKSHALTATLMNSELGLATVIQGCEMGIELMQRLNMTKLFTSGACNWGGNPLSFFNMIHPEVADENASVLYAAERVNFTGKTNSYDSSLVWIVGGADVRTTITKASVTADTVTYNVTVSFVDRFDFSTSSNSGFKNLISGLGALLFKEFDWAATATFSVTVDNGCPHDTDAYYWRYDAGTQSMASITTDEFGENQAEKYTIAGSASYYELDRTVTLLHNVPWELEYTVKNPGQISLSPTQGSFNDCFDFQLYYRSHFFIQNTERIGDTYKHHCYGYTLANLFHFAADQTYTIRLENVIAENGSNMIYVSVYNHDLQKTVLKALPMDDYYWMQNGVLALQDDESGRLSGEDLRIQYIGNVNYPFASEIFELKVWENGKNGESNGCFTDKTIKPACAAKGYTTHTCSLCGYSYKDTYVAAIGHSYGGWTQVKAPDCTAVGQEQRTCKTCKETETRDITPNGHNYEAVVTEPTCTEDGYTTNTCSVCGDTYQDTYVDQLGHEYEDGICIRCGESEIVLGDVNGDGSIDTTDAYYIVLYYNEKMDLSAEQLLAADVNGDGAVDTTDAYYIVLFYNEKIDQFPS
jgi:hypothetical protein